MKIRVPLAKRLNQCYRAGEHIVGLEDATLMASIKLDYREARPVGDYFLFAANHASSISTTMTGEARKAALDLSKRLKGLRARLVGKSVIPKEREAFYRKEIFKVKDLTHWLKVSAKAQCGNEAEKFSLRKFKRPN